MSRTSTLCRSKIFGCIRWRNPSDSSSPPSASHPVTPPYRKRPSGSTRVGRSFTKILRQLTVYMLIHRTLSLNLSLNIKACVRLSNGSLLAGQSLSDWLCPSVRLLNCLFYSHRSLREPPGDDFSATPSY